MSPSLHGSTTSRPFSFALAAPATSSGISRCLVCGKAVTYLSNIPALLHRHHLCILLSQVCHTHHKYLFLTSSICHYQPFVRQPLNIFLPSYCLGLFRQELRMSPNQVLMRVICVILFSPSPTFPHISTCRPWLLIQFCHMHKFLSAS